nr:hypothetical protein [uncultured Butyricicoccus sp.]
MDSMTYSEKLVDIQHIVAKLDGLPHDALMYIAGYVEGCRDAQSEKYTTEKPAS